MYGTVPYLPYKRYLLFSQNKMVYCYGNRPSTHGEIVADKEPSFADLDLSFHFNTDHNPFFQIYTYTVQVPIE